MLRLNSTLHQLVTLQSIILLVLTPLLTICETKMQSYANSTQFVNMRLKESHRITLTYTLNQFACMLYMCHASSTMSLQVFLLHAKMTSCKQDLNLFACLFFSFVRGISFMTNRRYALFTRSPCHMTIITLIHCITIDH